MKKIASIIIVFILIFFCGCERVAQNSADELKMNVWHADCKNGTSVALSFSHYGAEMKIITNSTDSADEITATIKGICTADDSEFIIFDEVTGQSFRFGYGIRGNKCDITYGGSLITLERSD